VNWGDGKEKTYNRTDHLIQCHMTYQYEKMEETYMVHAMYCSMPGSLLERAEECTSVTCDSFVMPVTVSDKPPNEMNL